VGSARYLIDYHEVKAMGRLNSAVRTADQTIASLFWNWGTAGSIWNNLALALIDGRNRDRKDHSPGNQQNTLFENARLLAALNLSIADAAIGCWTAKYTYTYWRPITAVREDTASRRRRRTRAGRRCSPRPDIPSTRLDTRA
jgi:hypothetical protein